MAKNSAKARLVSINKVLPKYHYILDRYDAGGVFSFFVEIENNGSPADKFQIGGMLECLIFDDYINHLKEEVTRLEAIKVKLEKELSC